MKRMLIGRQLLFLQRRVFIEWIVTLPSNLSTKLQRGFSRMDKAQFYDWFKQQVLQRWPRWPVNKTILSDWFVAFGRYDVELLTAAVRRHKIKDDPYVPSTKKLLEIIRAIAPPRPDESEIIEPENVVTYEQFRQHMRTSSDREMRIECVVSLSGFAPEKAKAFDAEAWQWALEEGLIKVRQDRMNNEQKDVK